MSVSVWLGDKVDCKATLRGVKYKKAKAVEFVFQVGDKEVGRAKGDLDEKTGVATCTWEKAAGPDDKQLWACVSFYLQVDDLQLRNFAQDIYVWRKTIDVVAKREDGKPFPNAVCVLTQTVPPGLDGAGTKKPSERKTDKDGKITFDLMYADEFELSWQDPFFLLDGKWLKDEGIVREAKLKKPAWEAELVSPKPGATHKQFVNLDASDKKPEHGTKLKLELKAKKPDLVDDGDKVYVIVAYDEHNSKRTPTAPNPGPGKELKLEGVLKGGKCTVEVELGLAGGDKAQIKYGSTPTAGDGTLDVVNWREITYQISMSKKADPVKEAEYQEGMRDSFIDPVAKPAVELVDASAPAGSFVKSDVFGFPGDDKLVVGGHNRKDFWKLKAKDARLHYLMCDLQIDPGGSKLVNLVCKKEDKFTPPAGGADVRGKRVTGKDDFAGKLVLPVVLGSPAAKPVVTCEWKSTAAAAPHKDKKGTIPEGNITVDYANSKAVKGAVYVQYPAEVLEILDANEGVTLKLEMKLAAGPYNGESSGDGQILIALYASAKRDGLGVAGTMVHEAGHAIGMVLDDKYDVPGIKDPRVTHGRHYTARGHSGNHCADGVSDAIYGDNTIDMKGKSGTCVMFGEGWAGRPRTFCDRCKPFVLALSLKEGVK